MCLHVTLFMSTHVWLSSDVYVSPAPLWLHLALFVSASIWLNYDVYVSPSLFTRISFYIYTYLS